MRNYDFRKFLINNDSKITKFEYNLKIECKVIFMDLYDSMEKNELITELKQLKHDLNERGKELDGIRKFSAIIDTSHDVEEILAKTIEIIPEAWQYPDITAVRIIYSDIEFKTKNFNMTQWKLSSDIVVENQKYGVFEVYYLQEKPPKDIGPFTKEEKALLDTLTERMGKIIIRIRLSNRIKIQSQEILAMSTPVIEILPGIVIAPLIGTLDSERTQRTMETILKNIVDTKSSVALIDITGVPTIDTATAQHLMDTVRAVKLLGAKSIVTGISPQIAQTIVHLGIDLSEILSFASLADGFKIALGYLGLKMEENGKILKR